MFNTTSPSKRQFSEMNGKNQDTIDREALNFLHSMKSAQISNSDSRLMSSTNSTSSGLVSPPITPQNQRIIDIKPDIDADNNDSRAVKRLKFSDSTTCTSSSLQTPPTTPEKALKPLEISNINNKLSTHPLFDKNDTNIYFEAKKVFSRGSIANTKSNNYILAGREKEARLLKSYIRESLMENKSLSVYVSGPPGTGKTAQVTKLLNSMTREGQNDEAKVHTLAMFKDPATKTTKISRKARVVKINCMTIRRSEDIFDLIYKKIAPNEKYQTKKTSQDLMNLLLDENKSNTCNMTILLLDEIDNLINSNQQTLFELFSWSTSTISEDNKYQFPKIILISIANALDLTDRFLPRLRSNNINPKLMQFLPYSADQIQDVIKYKLEKLSYPEIFHPSAIVLCAKKSAVNTGDLRKALDICYRSIEMTELNAMKLLATKENQNLTVDQLPKVTIATISKICNTSYGSKYLNDLKNFNLQHKAILCSLIKFDEHKNKLLQSPITKRQVNNTVNGFYDYYLKSVQIDKVIGTLKKTDFLEIVSSLESASVISLGVSKSSYRDIGMRKITCTIPKADVARIVQEIPLLAKIINSEN